MAWGDFFELFFNREKWRGMRWCGMLLKFSQLFLMKNGDVTWADFLEFLELFFNKENDVA
jgi:hypothetical protein